MSAFSGWKGWAAWLVVGFLAAASVRADGPIHERIAEATRQIEADPKNAELYLKRGELHRIHRDWRAALADYDRAAALDPKLEVVDLARGETYLEANCPNEARAALNRFLARNPAHDRALAARARARVKLEDYTGAAEDFALAIKNTAISRPEYYLERAQAQVSAGDAHWEEALQSLDEGMKKIGPALTLQLAAIDLELKQQRYDAALGRLGRITAQAERKDSWMARRGDILRQAGRMDEAKEAFQSALKELEALPESRRKTPATLELEEHLRTALQSKQSK